MMSNFSWKDNSGNIRQIPVMYGDMTRQVANIIKENSENKLPSVPRMAVYITGLEMDRERTSDSSYVSKLNIRERFFDEEGNEYTSKQGKNYTIERLMPSPYTLSVNVDIWSSNTDQKLQIIEQILTLFNPSLEIQTTDNYVDWTSLTVVNLESINISSRTIPVGTESEIDIATLAFTTPIYISPPAKVKKLGVITNIITSILNEPSGTIELGNSIVQTTGPYSEENVIVTSTTTASDTAASPIPGSLTTNISGQPEQIVDYGEFPNTGDGDMDMSVRRTIVPGVDGLPSSTTSTTWSQLGIFVFGETIKLIFENTVGGMSWQEYLETLPGCNVPGVTKIRIVTEDGNVIIGNIYVNTENTSELMVEWDTDTLPSNTVLEGPARDQNSWTSIDYIIDPLRWNPTSRKIPGLRLLTLGRIGDALNTDGADGWKNDDGSELIADENDIIEWDGVRWHVIFVASISGDTVYTKNLRTNMQYKWTGAYWTKSYEGEYPAGTWSILPDG